MSKVDIFEVVSGDCKRLEEDVKVLVRIKTEHLTFSTDITDSLKDSGAFALLTEGIRHPEFRKILLNILELRVQKARNDAVEECQKFLQKHVVAEVMES